MSNDKKTHMAKANKTFQERLKLEKLDSEKPKEITIVPDINPNLSSLLGPLMKNQS